MRVHWRCRCDEGWVGKECGVAVCDTEGCLNGECVAPDECVCYSGWGSNNCTLDQLTKEQATAYLDGLMVKVRKLPALVVHKNEEGYRDSWKCVLRVPAPPFHSCCSSHYFSLQLKSITYGKLNQLFISRWIYGSGTHTPLRPRC